jgi:hypothetical protein
MKQSRAYRTSSSGIERGSPFAIGPAGLSVRRFDHALFEEDGFAEDTSREDSTGGGERTIPRFRKRTRPGKPEYQCRDASFGRVGGNIGRSIYDPALARAPISRKALLLGLLNVRLGHWWDSGVEPGQRQKTAHRTASWRLGKWAGRMVSGAGGRLPDELLARFHGPARRHWYLSDGGHFENTAMLRADSPAGSVHHLLRLRRRSNYRFEDVANLVRKARLDFGTDITFLSEAETNRTILPASEGCDRAAFRDLVPMDDEDESQRLSQAHAALARN